MSKRKKLGREVAIVGAGMSQFGLFPEKNSKDLFLEAFLEMRDSVDKGVDLKEVEALYLGNFTNDFFTHQAHTALHPPSSSRSAKPPVPGPT